MIWTAHLEWLETEDGHAYQCVKCMGTGRLLCCDTPGCELAMHEECASKIPFAKEKWFCDHCKLVRWAHKAVPE